MKKLGKTLENTLYSIKYIWEISPQYIMLTIFGSVVASAFNIISLYVLKYIATTLEANNVSGFLSAIVLMFVISIVLSMVNGNIGYLLEPIMQNNITEKIQNDIYEKAKQFYFEEFENKDFYNLYYFVIENGKSSIVKSVNMILGILTCILSSFGICGIVLQYDFVVVIIAGIGVVISYVCSMQMKQIQHNFKIDTIPNNREISYIQRIFYIKDYIKEILAFSQSNVIEEKYKEAWKNLNNLTKKWGKRLCILYIIIMQVNEITELLILVYLGYQVITGKILLSEFLVLYTGIQQMIQQLKLVIENIPELYSNALDIDKCFEFMNKKTGHEKDLREVDRISFIKFKDVSFSYDNERKNIDKVSFELGDKIKTLAIVGKNGSGKSTITKLLTGFYHSYTGDIYINDTNLNLLSRESYRARIAIMFQDFKLFSMTIAQNLKMKYEINDFEKREINTILDFVQLNDEIRKLPNKTDTILSKEFDENGIYLSGGEQQKIALARSLLQQADVIILDEPFSNMDNLSATKVLNGIRRIIGDRMLILITHRLEGLSDIDEIIFMEDGCIAERGTEKELLQKQGKYYELYEININR